MSDAHRPDDPSHTPCSGGRQEEGCWEIFCRASSLTGPSADFLKCSVPYAPCPVPCALCSVPYRSGLSSWVTETLRQSREDDASCSDAMQCSEPNVVMKKRAAFDDGADGPSKRSRTSTMGTPDVPATDSDSAAHSAMNGHTSQACGHTHKTLRMGIGAPSAGWASKSSVERGASKRWAPGHPNGH